MMANKPKILYLRQSCKGLFANVIIINYRNKLVSHNVMYNFFKLGRPIRPAGLPGEEQAPGKLGDNCYAMIPAGLPRPYPCPTDTESRSPLSIRNSPSPPRPISPTAPDDLSLSKRVHSPINTNSNPDSTLNINNNNNNNISN